MARNILKRLVAKRLTELSELAGSALQALGRPVAGQAARQGEQVVEELAAHDLAGRARSALGKQTATKSTSSVAGRFGRIAEVGSAHKPGEGLSQQDVMDLLHDFYKSAPSKKMLLQSFLEQHMPTEVYIPWVLPREAEGVPSERLGYNAIANAATWLSTLSKLPKELFKRSGPVELQYVTPARSAVAGYFLRAPRLIIIPHVAPRSKDVTEAIAPWTLVHEATHSLQDDLKLYDAMRDFLASTLWRFPVEPRGEFAKEATTGAVTPFDNPEAFYWWSGIEYIPAFPEELFAMVDKAKKSGGWPEAGSPIMSPPYEWAKAPNPKWPGQIYAETNPLEDIAESAAARYLGSHPELLEGISNKDYQTLMRVRASALESDPKRYKPITEFLKAAGVPLTWLLYLLQRRYGQEEVS